MPQGGAEGPGRRVPTSRAASLVLTALGAAVLVVGDLALYGDRELFDSDRFADHAVASLEDQAVREAAGRRITRTVVRKVDPDLVAVEAVIEPAATGIVGTSAFRAGLRQAVRDAHAIALGRGEETAAVRVANVGAVVAGAIEALSPRLARQIPDGLDTKLLELGDAGFSRDAARVAREVGEAAVALPILAVLLLVAGVAVAADRRGAVTRTGVAVAVTGALVVVGYSAGQSLLPNAAADQLDGEALQGIWSAMLGELRDWNLALAAIGAVVAGAGAAVLRPLDALAPLRRLGELTIATPSSPWLRAARAAALITVGLLLVLEPGFVLRAVAVVAGLVTISAGVGELIRLTIPEPSEAESARAQGRRLAVALLIGAGCVAVIAVVAVSVLGGSDDDSDGEPPPTGACNGSLELCERTLDEAVFPATHNSMSAAGYPGYLFPMQERTIPRQLDDGVRALLIDAYYGIPGRRVYTDFDRGPNKLAEQARAQLGPGFIAAAGKVRADIARPQEGAEARLYLCHGFCELGAIDLLDTLRKIDSFLATHPEEVLLITIEDYVDPKDIVNAFERSGLADRAYGGPLGPEFPTLGELIESGERLIVLAENRAGGAPWYRLAYDFFQETPFDFSKPAVMSCDPNRGAASNPLFLINNWINTDPAAKPSNAKKVNAHGFLLKRVQRCARRRDLVPNLIAVDFYREGDLLGVAEELNREGG